MICEYLFLSSSGTWCGRDVCSLLAWSTAKVFALRSTALLKERTARRYVDSHTRGICLWETLQKSWKKMPKAWRRKARASSGPSGSGSSLRPHWPNAIACICEFGRPALRTSTVKCVHALHSGLRRWHCSRWSMLSSAVLHRRHVCVSLGCLFRTFRARWTSLRQCFSSVASDRSVPKVLNMMLKRMMWGMRRLQARTQLGNFVPSRWSAKKCVVLCTVRSESLRGRLFCVGWTKLGCHPTLRG